MSILNGIETRTQANTQRHSGYVFSRTLKMPTEILNVEYK